MLLQSFSVKNLEDFSFANCRRKFALTSTGDNNENIITISLSFILIPVSEPEKKSVVSFW
jgi:hypothetical protein